MEVLLISEQYLKTNSYLNDNVGSEFIRPAIQTSQEIGLQPLIGTVLYEKLLNLVETGEIVNNDNYKKLLDEYITPYLTFKVLSDIQIPLSYKIRNAGITQSVDTQMTTNDLPNVRYLVEYYDNKAKFYAERLSSYLCANTTKYPEYHQRKSAADMRANPNAYNTGIVL